MKYFKNQCFALANLYVTLAAPAPAPSSEYGFYFTALGQDFYNEYN
jgi:hypothetical protein